MAHWIEYPPDPKELLLAWQAPASVPDRSRWAVGRLFKVNGDPVFDYLSDPEFSDLNLGRTRDELLAAGYSGYPAFASDARKRPQGGFRDHALEAFLRRVPPRSRADFPDYLAHYGIKSNAALSPFALLAVTEARLPSDGFSLIDPLDPTTSCADATFEIAGFRYFDTAKTRADILLQLQPESSNPKDSSAIQVASEGQVIGYVNRLQTKAIAVWLKRHKVDCWLARLNGIPSAPRAYGLLRVRPLGYSDDSGAGKHLRAVRT